MFLGVFEVKWRQIKGNDIKSGVGEAENAAPTLFLCPKKPKVPVCFYLFYTATKSEQKVRTERFELYKNAREIHFSSL